MCSGMYAHNLFLEFVCKFKILFELALSIIIVVAVGVLRGIKNDDSCNNNADNILSQIR